MTRDKYLDTRKHTLNIKIELWTKEIVFFCLEIIIPFFF